MAVRKGPIAWVVALTLLASVVLGPAAALAQRAAGGRSGGGGVIVGNPTGSRPSPHHRGAPNAFGRRSFSHRPFAPLGTGVVFYAPGPYAYGDYAYGAYAPPSYDLYTYAPPSLAPPPPMPTVIEYPTGRYELRGDGITTPYRWVWIPNPPPAPPAAPPPPDAPTSPAPPASRDPGPARQTTVYRWTDEQGVLHLTDRRDAVPARYRR